MASGDLIDDAFLSDIDDIRGIPGQIGIRPTSITRRVVTFLGGKPGQGNQTFIDQQLLVGIGSQSPKVAQVTDKDAMASGGLYTNQAVRVGPMTPGYAASIFSLSAGVPASVLNPPMVASGASAEIFFKLSGGGYQFPVWFKRVSDEVISATKYFVVLERSGNQQPGGAP